MTIPDYSGKAVTVFVAELDGGGQIWRSCDAEAARHCCLRAAVPGQEET
jgi:hypothetical protein